MAGTNAFHTAALHSRLLAVCLLSATRTNATRTKSALPAFFDMLGIGGFSAEEELWRREGFDGLLGELRAAGEAGLLVLRTELTNLAVC